MASWIVPAAVASALGGYSVVRSLAVPNRWHLWANAGFALALLAVARIVGLDGDDLGFGGSAGPAVVLGLATWAVVSLILVTLARTAATRRFLLDERSAVPGTRVVLEVLVVIPIGTVLLEEVAFRGVLLGLFIDRGAPGLGVVVTAALFGLWHISPTLRTAPGSRLVGSRGRAGVVTGMVAAMAVAGVVLAHLRLAADSLLAPVIAHAGVNGTAFGLSWWSGNRDHR